MANRNKKHGIGTVVEIPLEGGTVSYARLLQGAYVELFDASSGGDPRPTPEEVVRNRVLFRTAVDNGSVNRWKAVGVVPLETEYDDMTLLFSHRDAVSGRLSIRWRHLASGRWGERPAEHVECVGLEPSAVWSKEGMERRLADHFANRPNDALERIRVR